MEEKWKRGTVSFTNEELAIIKEYQDKYKISRSKTIRAFFLGGLTSYKIGSIIANPNSPMFKTMKPIVDSIFTTEILNKIEKESSEGFFKVKLEVKNKAMQDFQTVQNELKKFTNHDPVGRKPSPKRPRGHPVDYGLDKSRSKKNPK